MNTPKSKNALVAKFRKWHTWTGLIAALFLLVVGASGVVLNYKKPIFTALGMEPDKAPKEGKGNSKLDVRALPVSFDRALELAAEELGKKPIERVELKREGATWIYKIKQAGGSEAWVNGISGETFVKENYTRAVMANGSPKAAGTDWGKLLLDLHTGKIGGEIGKAVMTAAAALLLFLTLSGVYLYAKPLLIRRRNRATQAAHARVSPTQPTPTKIRAEEVLVGQ